MYSSPVSLSSAEAVMEPVQNSQMTQARFAPGWQLCRNPKSLKGCDGTETPGCSTSAPELWFSGNTNRNNAMLWSNNTHSTSLSFLLFPTRIQLLADVGQNYL